MVFSAFMVMCFTVSRIIYSPVWSWRPEEKYLRYKLVEGIKTSVPAQVSLDTFHSLVPVIRLGGFV